MRRFGALLFALLAVMLPCFAMAQAPEARLALVIGEANYKVAPLATPLNDAGLVAATLKEAGFAVTEGADLNGADLRKALHDFVIKAEAAGPNTILFVYLAGRGVQFAGQNYFVPVDARVEREADVPVATVRLSDYLDRLTVLPAKARIFVFDGARILHFATEGAPFASGFGIANAALNTVYAFNEAPGAVSPDEPGPYGIYALSLVEMLRQGFAIPQVFAAVRLRANALSDGIVVPWNTGEIAAPFALYTRDKTAPPLPPASESAPAHSLPVAQAYLSAVARDTLDAYADFCAAFPNEPLTLRVRTLLAARREALTWRAALDAGTPQAIWTYMRRYPRGPHFPDARRRLAALAAPLDPPPRFDPYDFKGLPGPSETELEILDRPVLSFEDPAFPPPPAVDGLLPERPVEFEHVLPPAAAAAPGLLPIPGTLVLPFSKPNLPAALANVSSPSVAVQALPPAPLAPEKAIGAPPAPGPAPVAVAPAEPA
ncbi:MAG: caspase family protein, partial [Methylovirgula sp.]|nr:caspase family protein [Methylovirgula sp.]